MLVEMRTYTIHPGKIGDYLRLYENEGMKVQKSILGRMVGYYRTEIGTLNQVVHLWAYEDFADRDRRRATLLADATWTAYLPKMLPLLISQESTLLFPAPFFTPAWQP
jgi:hypothetical protein